MRLYDIHGELRLPEVHRHARRDRFLWHDPVLRRDGILGVGDQVAAVLIRHLQIYQTPSIDGAHKVSFFVGPWLSANAISLSGFGGLRNQVKQAFIKSKN